MAGKHVGTNEFGAVAANARPPAIPSTRVNRAWAEGYDGSRPNGHVSGSPESESYIAGAASQTQEEAGGKTGGVIHSPEADAASTRMNTGGSSLTAQEDTALKFFVDAEVANGNYANMDEYYCFGWADSVARLKGMKAFTVAEVGTGVTFSPGGIMPVTSAGAVRMSVTLPSLPLYSLTNAFAGTYVTTVGVPGAGVYIFGAQDGGAQRLRFRWMGTTSLDQIESNCNAVLSSNLTPGPDVASGQLLSTFRDPGAPTVQGGSVSTSTASEVQAATDVPTVACDIAAYNNNGTPASGDPNMVHGVFAIGAWEEAANTVDLAGMQTSMATLMANK